MSKKKKRWLMFSTTGLLLTGLGLSLTLDAAFFKQSGAPTLHWVSYGTVALSVFNSGISLFGQAVIERIKLEKEKSS